MSRLKVIIIGGGFGGLSAAQSLKKADVDILLIDKTNHHLFQPLLYEVATAALAPGEIAVPIREILRHQENVSVIMGEVSKIDKESKNVTLADGSVFSFDYLIVAVGAKHSYFGNDSWESVAPGLKTLSDALRIRENILMSFEKAERLDDISQAARYLNFVIIGAGPTGVEMAGAIAEIAYHTLFNNFRRINPAKSKIYLIEAAPNILPMFPEKLSHKAKKMLEKLGVVVLTGKLVTRITKDGVEIGDRLIESENIIWAAGNQASPLLKTLDTELDRQGRVKVGPDLAIPGHPSIFVVGDAACALDENNKPIPGIAPAAIQGGSYVASVIRSKLPQEKRKPFRYFDKGSLAVIGKGKAVGKVGKLQFGGFFAWLAWAFIHVVYLVGFRNRFSVFLEWFFFFFTGQRGARLIYRSFPNENPNTSKNT